MSEQKKKNNMRARIDQYYGCVHGNGSDYSKDTVRQECVKKIFKVLEHDGEYLIYKGTRKHLRDVIKNDLMYVLNLDMYIHYMMDLKKSLSHDDRSFSRIFYCNPNTLQEAMCTIYTKGNEVWVKIYTVR